MRFVRKCAPRRGIQRLAMLVVSTGLMVVISGCAGKDRTGRPDELQSKLNVLCGQHMATAVTETLEEPGQVILLHLSMTPGVAEQWKSGLRKGLGGKYDVVELGPEQVPAEYKGAMGGYPALRYALNTYPDAAAIVTALPVGAYERPRFSESHPPLFALAWSYMPDAVHLLNGKHLAAGIFDRPGRDPRRDLDPSLAPDALFDRNFIVATPENYRSVATPYLPD